MEENRNDNLGEAISEEAVAKAVSESEKVAGEVSLESTETVEAEVTEAKTTERETVEAEAGESTAAEVPIAEDTEAENPETTEAQEQAVLASESRDNSTVGEVCTDASQPKKKSKSALIIGIGIAAVTAVGIGVAAVGSLFQNDTVKFLQYQEKFLKEKTEGFVEGLKQWETMDTDLTVSGKFLDTSSDTLGIGSYLEGSSLVLKMKSDAKKEQALFNYLLTVQGTPILEYGIHMDKEEVAFAIPSVDENLYTGNIRTIYQNLTGIELTKLHYDAKELEEVLKPYFVDFTQSFTKKSLQVNRAVQNPYRTDKEVTEYTFAPDREEIISYIEKIAKRMKDDTAMKDLHTSFMVGYRAAEDIPSYEESIENLLTRKEEIADSLVDSGFAWKLGVQSGEVAYIQIMYMGMERFSYALEDESDTTRERYTIDEEVFINQYADEGGRIKGSVSDDTVAFLSYDYNPKEMSKLGVYEGSYMLSLGGFEVDFTVDVNGGDDSHVFKIADMVEVDMDTTKTSSVTELSGTEVDINNWSEEDFTLYLESIGRSVQQIMFQLIGF